MVTRSYFLGFVFVALLGALSINCAARTQGTSTPLMNQSVGPGPLLPIETASQDFFAEHQVEISWEGNSRNFRAVLQKRGDTLELIMLGPMEQPVVRVFQHGEDVGMERIIQRALPFEPEYILADVQKAFLPWTHDRNDLIDGEELVQEGVYETLHWRQVSTAEGIQERRFWRDDIGEEVSLRVVYEYEGDGQTPSAVTLDNTWLSYTLRIQTLRWAPL